jgi:hypothetical protein
MRCGEFNDERLVDLVPEDLQDGLRRYFLHGVEPGGFLKAVLSNDMMRALGLANENHAHFIVLRKLTWFIYNYTDSRASGSKGAVDQWLESWRRHVDVVAD